MAQPFSSITTGTISDQRNKFGNTTGILNFGLGSKPGTAGSGLATGFLGDAINSGSGEPRGMILSENNLMNTTMVSGSNNGEIQSNGGFRNSGN